MSGTSSVSAFLQSATNPENGTASYTYNSRNPVASKTAAKSQKTQFTYGSYNRMTQVSRCPAPGTTEDLSQRVNYWYDTNPYDNGAFSNIRPRA